jgi:ABC-type multidrug transport system, ATPase and permease components
MERRPHGYDAETANQPRKLRVLFRLSVYLSRFKWMLALALLLTVASNLFSLIGPQLSGYAITAIEPGKGAVDFEAVIYYCALMLIFYAASSILSYILSKVMITLTQRTVYQMRDDVFKKLLKLPVGYFDLNQTGDIISRMSYDIDTINATLSTDFIQICTSAITVIGSLVMMLTISPKLCLIFAVTIPASIGFTKYMTTKVRPLFKKRSAKLGELNGYAEEMLSGQKTIKAYNREKVMIGRFEERNEGAVDAYYKADYYGSITGPSVNFINNLSLSLVSMFGALMYLAGTITLGSISTFIQYSRRFSGPINEFANIISELQSAAAAAERVFRLLDSDEESADIIDAVTLSDVKGKVDIEHVDFGYIPEKIILKDLNINVKPGSTIAIVGPTGAGKTTIINLLMRFYDPNRGVISVEDTDIMEATRKSLRRSYTMVLQDTWLFSGTIAENIAYGKENTTLDEVKAAAKAAHIHSYIEALPLGYDTVLTDDGVNISKGQKQLITIARAMISDSSMLILDEATSNVDSRTEILIQEAMSALMVGRTCFTIAHRLSTIKNADVILVLRDGRIIEQGNHESLLAGQGFYASLYNSQFD